MTDGTTDGTRGSTTNTSGQGGTSSTMMSATPSASSALSTNSSTASTTGGPVVSPIPFTDGWAPLDANILGIQGAFYVAADSSGGGNSLIQGDFAGTRACARGIAAQVLSGPDGAPDYARYWGTLMGFNLVQEAGSDVPLSYDAAFHGIVAFGFNIGGANPLPPAGVLRFSVRVYGDSSVYCTELRSSGVQVAYLTDMRRNCWEQDATEPSPDATRLEALHWQYATNAGSSYAFDLCIDELVAWVF